MCRRRSAACLERAKSESEGREAFVDRQRESSGRIRKDGMIESEEGVAMAAACLGSKGTTESMRVVKRTRGKKRKASQNS